MADSSAVEGVDDSSQQVAIALLLPAPSFPPAAQPDIVRAHQKDALYLQVLTDSCHDAARSVLGPRRALLWSREVRLVAEILYHGLTTGCGAQTLGEEYCDILQVSERAGLAPGLQRRGLLVLLETLGPALAAHICSDGSTGFGGSYIRTPSVPAAPAAAEGATSAAAAGSWVEARQASISEALARWQQLCSVLVPYSSVAVRLHLALFYFYGRYYQWSKRSTGVRYIFMGKALEARPSYKILGALLFMQLGLSAGSSAVSLLAKSYASRNVQLNQPIDSDRTEARQQRGRRCAVVLDADGREGTRGTCAAELVPAGDVPMHRRCPLCLGARAVPTATPCGHVFCWTCIAAWGNQKPECPLCRASFDFTRLVPVYSAGF